MPKKPTFDTIGDEPIEARIVAWVLGDASAFEATELERLCGERPELLVFRRRMLALHGLLSEAAVPDHTTKLPPAKRQRLDELFAGEKSAGLLEIQREARVRHGWRRRLLAIAACLLLLVVLGGLTAPQFIRMRKKASAMEFVALQTDYPPELLEGTPRPIILPGVTNAPAKPDAKANYSLRGPAAGKPQDVLLAAKSKKVAAEATRENLTLSDADEQLGEMAARTSEDGGRMSGGLGGSGAGRGFGTATGSAGGNGRAVEEAKPNSGLVAGNVAGRNAPAAAAPPAAAAAAAAPPASRPMAESADALAKARLKPADEATMSALLSRRIEKRSEAIKRGLDAQDEVDARRDLEAEEKKLAQMQQELAGLSDKSGKPDKSDRSDLSDKSDPGALAANLEMPATDLNDLFRGAGALGADADSSFSADYLDSTVPAPGKGEKFGLATAGAKPGSDSEGRSAGRPKGEMREGEVSYDDGVKKEAAAKAPAAAESKSTSDIIRDFDRKSNAAVPAETAAAGPGGAAEPQPGPLPPAGPVAHETGAPRDAKAAQAGARKDSGPANEWGYLGDTTVNGGTLELYDSEAAKQPAAGAKPAQSSGLAQREMLRRQSVLADSDRYLVEARDAFTKGTYQQAYENYAKALALLPDAPATKDRRDFLRKALGDVAVALANQAIDNGQGDAAKDWLGKAVEWDPSNAKARQKVVADVASETAAAEVPYSTLSLSISDASFKMAQAALARGERPDPSSIKVEQFYNAVDYGDPAPSVSEAVAARVEQAAHPVIPGRNLVRVAMRTGAAGRSAAQPLRLTLLVDQSGSMVRDDRRAAMEIALKQLGGLLTKNDLVTVIGFARSPRLLADALTGDQGTMLSEVVNQAASEGGTNLEEAMKLGEQMALRHQTAGAQNRIVLFTDGAANLGNADPLRLAEKVKAMRQKGLAFDIAGIGTSNLNDQLLGELARHGNGRYCVVGAEKDATGSFARQLAGAFRPAAENVKVQVRFNPQRVGRYKLLGFEEHRLKTEDFRNDAVDAAELAAEEAGVALYQVEPLAEGAGEIGEVSVRFRDAASGQMVERSWTIPYEAGAPAFDRALPSLQLAGLALLAAEKLRGGPLAEAIDFKQLAAPRATVKQYYSNSRRVAEMLEMVNRL